MFLFLEIHEIHRLNWFCSIWATQDTLAITDKLRCFTKSIHKVWWCFWMSCVRTQSSLSIKNLDNSLKPFSWKWKKWQKLRLCSMLWMEIHCQVEIETLKCPMLFVSPINNPSFFLSLPWHLNVWFPPAAFLYSTVLWIQLYITGSCIVYSFNVS